MLTGVALSLLPFSLFVNNSEENKRSLGPFLRRLGPLFALNWVPLRLWNSALAFDTMLSPQVTDALAFLHSCHLVHTQLSSHAVMMVGGRQAKLAQFEGVVDVGAKFKPQKRSSWDEILPWVAPEMVVGGRKAEQRSDVYSLSCLIWEAVTCKVPWQGLSAEEVEEEVEQGAGLPLHDLPRYIRRLLRLGLLWEMAERDVDLDEVRDMLLVTRRREEERLVGVAAVPSSQRRNEEQTSLQFSSGRIPAAASSQATRANESNLNFDENAKVNKEQDDGDIFDEGTSAPSIRNRQLLFPCNAVAKASPVPDTSFTLRPSKPKLISKVAPRNSKNPPMRLPSFAAPNYCPQRAPSTSSDPSHITKPSIHARLPGNRRMCVTGADQRRDKSPNVEDVQPNFGEVRGRFERLSLPSLIEVKRKEERPSSQRQPATSLSPNLQRQEMATNVAKLVEVRKTRDNNQPSIESAKGEGRVRELVRTIDLSKGGISYS